MINTYLQVTFTFNLGSISKVVYCSLVIYLIHIAPAFCQKNWKAQVSGTDRDLHSIAFGAGEFVVVGENGTILTSSDGEHWETQKSGVNNTLYKVIYGGGKFVAVGESSILTSTNGIEWIAYQPASTYKHLRGITYGNGKYMAVAGFSGILTSIDGVNWTAHSSANTNYFTSVSYGNNLFVAVGGKSSVRSLSIKNSRWTEIYYSHPTELPSQKLADFTDVAYGKDLYVAVGAKAVLTSTNGINWAEFANGELPYFYGICYGANQFVAVGFNGSVRTSFNPMEWTSQSSYTDQLLYGVGTNQKKFIAVGAGGTIISSSIDTIPVQSTNLEETDSKKYQLGTYRKIDTLALNKKNSSAKSDITSSLNKVSQRSTTTYLAELVQHAEKPSQAVAYPNPSESGRFTLMLPPNTLRFRIVTLKGEVLRTLSDPFSLSDLDLSDFASGLYLLQIDTTTGSRVVKLIRL